MIKKYFDLKLLLLAILSAALYSIAITSFSIPANMFPGGLSGITRILTSALSKYFSINIAYSVIYFPINILISVAVYKYIGKKFAIYSIIQFSLVSLFTLFFKPLFVLENDFLYAIFGGLLQGLSVGIALSFDFSTGGSDFVSVYFSSKYKKSFWNYTFLMNMVILLLSGILFDWNIALYSIIYQYCSTQIIKALHKRYTFTTLTIITTKPIEVADEIQKNIRHGITEIHAHGHYSNSDTTMLYTVVNSFQYHMVIDIVRRVDEKAFINVQKTSEVYGNYFQKPLD